MLNKIIPSVTILRKFLNAIRAFFFPDFCALCDVVLFSELLLCKNCISILQPVASKKVVLSKKIQFTVFALSLYKPQLKPIIHAKYYRNRALFYELGKFMWEQQEALRNLDFDIIVPIPLYWTRYAWRGFNQAEEIAKGISQISGKPIVHLLKRSKKTKFQNTLNKEERFLNVSNTFSIALSVTDYLVYKDAKILLIDDLYTTGATITEAVKALTILPQRQGAFFNVVVFCRT